MKKRRLLTLVGSICLVLVLAASALIAACAPAPEAPLTPAEFYGQNTVTMVVPWGAGDTVDYAGRLIASFWPDYVPGGEMRVKNVVGAGGINAGNYVWKAEPDGLTMCITAPDDSIFWPTLFGAEGMEFDGLQFIWLGEIARSANVFAVSVKAPYESVEDLKGVSDFRFAGMGPLSGGAAGAAIVSEILGMKDATLIVGYESTEEISLALARGEADGTVFSAKTVAVFLEKGGISKEPFITLARDRTAYFPDVPALPEVGTLTPEQDKWVTLIQGMESCRAIFTRPGVPQDRVDFVRATLMKIFHAEGFEKMIRWVYKGWSEPRGGEEYGKAARDLMSITPAEIEALRQATTKMTEL